MKIRILIIALLFFCSCNDSQKDKITPSKPSSLTTEEKINMVLEGKQSPNAKITTIDGSNVEIKSFKGKLLIIDFWATWCSPCIKEAPLFKKLAEKYNESDVAFISISIDNDFLNWKDYILSANWKGNNYWYDVDHDWPFSYLLYSKSNSENKYKFSISLPKYVMISPNGKILSKSNVGPSNPQFEIAIQKYLNKNFG